MSSRNNSILRKLHVFGFSSVQEQTVMSSLLTGENMLIIGATGMSKTKLAEKIARALDAHIGMPFGRFSAPNDNFDDLVGYVNVAKMRDSGTVEYVPTQTTLWDKNFVFVDEINRKRAATAAKWFTVLDERQLCGFPMECRILWAAMNPSNFSGTSQLNEGEISRMASFLYPPEFVGLSEGDKVAVVRAGDAKRMPALRLWNPDIQLEEDKIPYGEIGAEITTLLQRAAQWQEAISSSTSSIDRFVAVYLSTLAKAFQEKKVDGVGLLIDGRRAGSLRRHIIAMRSISLAMNEIYGTHQVPLQKDVLSAILSGLPMGVNDAGGRSADVETVCVNVFRQLQSMLAEEITEDGWAICRELLTTNDPVRHLEILLTVDLNDFVKASFWEHLRRRDGNDKYWLGRLAALVEIERPGTIPPNALATVVSFLGEDAESTSDLNWARIIGEYCDGASLDKSVVSQVKKEYPDLIGAIDKVIAAKKAKRKVKTLEAMGSASAELR